VLRYVALLAVVGCHAQKATYAIKDPKVLDLQHGTLHDAAVALHARAKDPQSVETYLAELLQ
jgi:hypothetical protein